MCVIVDMQYIHNIHTSSLPLCASTHISIHSLYSCLHLCICEYLTASVAVTDDHRGGFIYTLYLQKTKCFQPSLISITLFLVWLSQAPQAHQSLWQWRKLQTVQPSWPGAPVETTAAPSPITWSRPELPSLSAGRGLTQVGSTWSFDLTAQTMLFR